MENLIGNAGGRRRTVAALAMFALRPFDCAAHTAPPRIAFLVSGSEITGAMTTR